MTFKQGGILRAMTAHERAQCSRLAHAAALAERLESDGATPEEITKAAALLASEPSARQPELELE